MLQRMLERMGHAHKRQFAKADHYRQKSAKPVVRIAIIVEAWSLRSHERFDAVTTISLLLNRCC